MFWVFCIFSVFAPLITLRNFIEIFGFSGFLSNHRFCCSYPSISPVVADLFIWMQCKLTWSDFFASIWTCRRMIITKFDVFPIVSHVPYLLCNCFSDKYGQINFANFRQQIDLSSQYPWWPRAAAHPWDPWLWLNWIMCPAMFSWMVSSSTWFSPHVWGLKKCRSPFTVKPLIGN
jgi:hypothetical protein